MLNSCRAHEAASSAQYAAVVIFVIINLYTLVHKCSWFNSGVIAAGVLQWTCFNSVFVLVWVRAKRPCKVFKSTVLTAAASLAGRASESFFGLVSCCSIRVLGPILTSFAAGMFEFLCASAKTVATALNCGRPLV